MPRLIGIHGLACAVPQNVRLDTGSKLPVIHDSPPARNSVGSVPHVSPPGSPCAAVVLNRHSCLPVAASYALMKHFSSRYVWQPASPWITLPLATSGPLLVL